MKKTSILLFILFLFSNVNGQLDDNGNPIFNSDLISEEEFKNFELTSSYYNIKDNISNKNSSAYISDNPTLDEYLSFSRDLPSNFFIVHKGQDIMFMIMLLQLNEGKETSLVYNFINPSNGEQLDIPCNVFGEISEKRVEELIELNVDSNSKILDFPYGKAFLYNGIAYSIQPFEELKAEVIEISTQLLTTGDEIKDPGPYVKKESIGGVLDFNIILENEEAPFFVFDGIAYSKKDFALLLWGKKVGLIGIKTIKKAITLWEEVHQRELTKPEKKALTTGFNS